MTTTPSSRQTALITGASSGIGLELAKLMARDGYQLVLTARSADALEELAVQCRAMGAEVVVIPQDLSVHDAAAALAAQIDSRNIQIDVLINNAGFGTHGLFWENDPAQEMALLELNVVALAQLSRLLLPGMVARRNGRILNVASTAAFQPGPLMANYYASKAYVLSFSEALFSELQGTGVTTTVLCPGPTLTNFQKRAGISNSRLMRFAGLSAAQVAEAGYRAMLKGKRVCIPGWANRLLIWSGRFTPRSMVLATVRSLNSNR